MNANLHIVADRIRRQASALDEPTEGPTQLSAPYFLRERAREYEQAQQEMAEWKPYPYENALTPRPSKALTYTAHAALILAVSLFLFVLVML
jgi:hypothetical protein